MVSITCGQPQVKNIKWKIPDINNYSKVLPLSENLMYVHIEGNIVYVGFGTIHWCRHPLGVWEVSPEDKGSYCTTLSWLLQLYSKSGNQVVSVLRLRSPSILSCSSGSFASPYKFQNQFCDIHKITCWDSDWVCFQSIDPTGKNWHFHYVKSLYPWTQNISPFI